MIASKTPIKQPTLNLFFGEKSLRIHDNMNLSIYLVFVFCFVSVIGCQRAPVKRVYREVVIERPQQASSLIPDDDIHAFLREGMPMAEERPVIHLPLSWTTPEGWQESAGGGMRLASFATMDKDNPVECTIVSLGGQAGGLTSNVARWMRQVNIVVPDAARLEQFISAQSQVSTQDGFAATIVDLTQLQSVKDLRSPSMIATVITLPDATVFVKMTGSRGALLKNKEKFEALCESLKLNDDDHDS